jgi:outer membrane murein-binding lipoprotein Lpp
MTGPEQAVAEQMRDRRRNGVVWLVVGLILAITLGVAYKSDARTEAQDQQLSTQSAEVETLKGQVHANGQIAQSAKDAAEEANRRLKAAGKPTVPVPTDAPVSPTVVPPAPVDELNGAETMAVRAIVSDQLSRQKVTITQAEVSQIARVASALVPKPKDGSTPTEAQIRPVAVAAVAAYCVGDKCVGPAGGEGPRGPQGEKGDPAPKVTDEELLASSKLALAAYCGLESQPCKGDKGEPGASVTGPPGPDGKDAPTIADMDCVGDDTESYWRIQFSTGPDKTALGPCRIGPDPN